MNLVFGMPEVEADKLASTLLSLMTPNNVLEKKVELKTVPGALIRVTVAMEERYDMVWFDLDVMWVDTKTRALAVVGSNHVVNNGVPDIHAGQNYSVILKKGRGKQWEASGMNTFSSTVYNEIAFNQPEEFTEPITKAMQLQERIERGLKMMFES